MNTAPANVRIDRFERAIRAALLGPPEISQRDLSEKLDITIGSLSKYLRGEVLPEKVGFGIQCRLAEVLGHSVDALMRYYDTGEWSSETQLQDVVSWLQSDATQADIPQLLQSLSLATGRLSGVSPNPNSDSQDYLWPLQELKSSGVSDKLRNKLGLSDEALWKLAKEGTFDDELVEAFSLACDFEESAVREAFKKRAAIA